MAAVLFSAVECMPAAGSGCPTTRAVDVLAGLFQLEQDPSGLANEVIEAVSHGVRWNRLVKVPHTLAQCNHVASAGAGGNARAARMAGGKEGGSNQGDDDMVGIWADGDHNGDVPVASILPAIKEQSASDTGELMNATLELDTNPSRGSGNPSVSQGG